MEPRDQHVGGLVFISYARVDAERVRRLVDYLSEQGISVWWDEEIEPGQRFRDAIYYVLEKANCVIVVWTRTSVQQDFVRSEADHAYKRGVLVPVLLDTDAQIPQPFEQLQHLNLSEWDGLAEKGIDRLARRVRALTQRKTSISDYAGTLIDNEWSIETSTTATNELRDLVSRMSSLGEVLTFDAEPVKNVQGALQEVEKTYRVVMEAIESFISPAIGLDTIAAEPYLKMERGVLSSDIENGRGHCLRILTYYGKAHGLRDWLEPRLDNDKLSELDSVFSSLGTADIDIFAQMTEIGRTLTNESRIIVNLLLSGQEAEARRRIIEGRQKLQPLEGALRTAQAELRSLESNIGFAT
jgi:hypothetical protein